MLGIQEAFASAAKGRKCPICGNRVSHGVYQRHFDKCKLIDDEEIVCLTPLPLQIGKHENKILKVEVNTNNYFGTERCNQKNYAEKLGAKQQHTNSTTVKRPSDPNSNQFQLHPKKANTNCVSSVPSNSEFKSDSPNSQGKHPITIKDCKKISIDSSSNTVNISQKSSSEAPEIDNSSCSNEIFDPQDLNQLCIDRTRFLLKKYRCANSQLDRPSSSTQLDRPLSNLSSTLSLTWENNEVHYSLSFFWEIILSVLSTDPREAIRIWGTKFRKIFRYVSLSVEAQYLLIRLCVRKWNWHLRKNLQSKYESISNLCSVIKDLHDCGFIETEISLSEMLLMLDVKQLRKLTKAFKLEGPNDKASLINQIEGFSKQPSSLFNMPSNSKEKSVLKKVKAIVGDECYRVSEEFLNIFNALLTQYSPNAMETYQLYDDSSSSIDLASTLLFTILKVKNDELKFVSSSPKISTEILTRIYQNSEQFFEYISSKKIEETFIRCINSKDYSQVLNQADKIKEQIKSELDCSTGFYSTLSVHQRQFTSPWILIRCLSCVFEAAEKMRDYNKAVEILKFLVSDNNIWHFCPNSRSKWYKRMVLNLDFHLKKPKEAYETCISAFSDTTLGEPTKLELQERAQKLAKRLKIEYMPEIIVNEVQKVTIEGDVIGKNLGDQRSNHFYISNQSDPGIASCNVEIVALKHFINNDIYKEGFHSEGKCWHTLFRLFFYDIIYSTHIPSVWTSSLQDDPLDLPFSTFYTNRKEEFDRRLEEIESSTTEELKEWITTKYKTAKGYGWSNSMLGWQTFENIDQLTRFVSCCKPVFLCNLFSRLAKDFKNNKSGFPDLTLWNFESQDLMVAEIKGPNDSLSRKQILWLNFFKLQGIRAVCCHVKAKNCRAL